MSDKKPVKTVFHIELPEVVAEAIRQNAAENFRTITGEIEYIVRDFYRISKPEQPRSRKPART